MAKKKSLLGTLVTLGGLAAAGAVAYQRREELKQLLKDTVERYFPDDEAEEEACEEADVIIDATGCVYPAGDESEETGEETPEN